MSSMFFNDISMLMCKKRCSIIVQIQHVNRDSNKDDDDHCDDDDQELSQRKERYREKQKKSVVYLKQNKNLSISVTIVESKVYDWLFTCFLFIFSVLLIQELVS